MSNTLDSQLKSVSDNRFGLRFLSVLLGGAIIAGGLTLFMHVLIESSQQELDESKRVNFLDFVRVKREEASQQRQQKPERPKTDETPPAPPTPQADNSNSSDTNLSVAAPVVGNAVDVEIGAIGIGQGDGEYLPIVKVAPAYPMKASIEGIEGDCMVQYTVTTNGSTKDIETVPGECMRIFARASIEAAKKFKYKPRQEDGVAIEVPNVRNLFHFRLDQTGGE